ncbi:MAG TPA: peptide chain release factor N(5)-glutamine methyltransferase [Gemmatimonadaceae bacterium]
MLVGALVESVRLILAQGHVAEDAAEARDIVAAITGQNRFWPRLHAQHVIGRDIVDAALVVAHRRARGMPFAYAVGRAAFRHLMLRVNESVLIPRQETEVLVDLVLATRRSGVVADVGTGSGALALALAAEGDFARVIATDVAADALAIARENAESLRPALKAPVDFRSGDLLAPLAGERLDVLVSNPPYIAYDEAPLLPRSVRDWEPAQALFSGSHGLSASRRIIQGGASLLCRGGLLALEVDSRRALQVAELVATNGAYRSIEVHQDLMGRDRFVLATMATGNA